MNSFLRTHFASYRNTKLICKMALGDEIMVHGIFYIFDSDNV